MTVDRSYVQRNAAERARLRRLVEQATATNLERALSDGWTVAVALAHLASWDRGTLATLEAWQHGGEWPPFPGADAINAAQLPVWQAMPARAAAQEAVAAAEAMDQTVEGLPAQVVEAIVAAGRLRILDRAHHRRAHLDAIEHAMSTHAQ